MKYKFSPVLKIFRLIRNFKNIFLSVLVLILSVLLVYTSHSVKNRKEVKESLAATITVNPGQSIQTAINSASAGDIIQVQAGTYGEKISLSKSNLTLNANGRVIVRGFTISGSQNTVRGFEIAEVNDNSGIYITGNNNLIENNEIYHTNQDGIWFFGAGNTFRGNYVHDILKNTSGGDPHADCFQTWGGVDGALFEKNICDHNRSSGSNQIVMLENLGGVKENPNNIVRNIIFRNNVFIMHDAGYSPLNLTRKNGQAEVSGMQVLNNTFYNTTGQGQWAIWAYNITNSVIKNNVAIGYGAVVQVDGGTVTQSNNVKSDGNGFVNYQNFDFHLLATSPLINAGVNVGVSDDFDGTPRPQGSGYDIGAFEFKSGYTSPNPSVTGVPTSALKPGDVNRDGKVDILDFQLLSNSFGKSSGQSGFNANADFNRDNTVNILDFQILSNNFGGTGVISTPTTRPTNTPTLRPTGTLPTQANSPTPFPTTIASRTFYVATTGSDSNSGTQSQPWKTIQKAASTLNSGEKAIVSQGSYPERVSVSRSGIILEASGQVITRGFSVSGSQNTIKGFVAAEVPDNAGFYVTGNNNLIENNEIYHTNQDGFWFFGAGNTYRGNYVHDILKTSITGDSHADCFQTWGAVDGALFENNTCDHNRTSGSNQIVMLENLAGVGTNPTGIVRNIIFRNNLFIMHDAGYSPMNFARKSSQPEISNMQVLNNTIVNTTGQGQWAVWMTNITNGLIQNNTVYGYGQVYSIDGGTVTQSGNILKPISEYKP